MRIVSGLSKFSWSHAGLVLVMTCLAGMLLPVFSSIHTRIDVDSVRINLSHVRKLIQEPTSKPATEKSIAEFGASIFIGGPWDLARCKGMVDKVLQYENIKKVSFLPTFYWYDSGPKEGAEGYGYNRFNTTELLYWCYTRRGNECIEVTEAEIEAFITAFGDCLSYATANGLDVGVNARVDDGRALGGWRNSLSFDPSKLYSKYSYETAILEPIAEALVQASKPGTEIEFTLQGEMGASPFFYPLEWVEVIRRIRRKIQLGRQNSGTEGPTKIGLGINNNKACGCLGLEIVNGREYLKFLETAFDPDLYPQGLEAIKKAFTEGDYISISAYVPMPNPYFETCEFEGLMRRMDEELSYYGFTLKDLVKAGVEIHFGEFGMGGGVSNRNNMPAKTAQQAAETPFFGVGGSYTCANDPFQMCYPDTPNEVRDYRRRYYEEAAKYFQSGGCDYSGVTVAYLWGLGSWDVLDIYPGDDGSEGNYKDTVVIETIENHNAIAQGLEI